MTAFEKFDEAMEQLARKHERSKVFVDFLDYYIEHHSKDKCFDGQYDDEELAFFKDALTHFITANKEIIKEKQWSDIIGEYYESYILADSKASSKGQFYTPRHVSDLISRIVGSSLEASDTVAYDPACGSARNLCDYHSTHPGVKCVGEDLDESACKMAVVNFHVNGVYGYVHWIDSLTREYMGTSWVVVNGRILVSSLDEIHAVEGCAGVVGLLAGDIALQEQGYELILDSVSDDSDGGVVYEGTLDNYFKKK